MPKLAKLLALPMRRLWRLGVAWVWLLCFDLALRRLSLPRIQHWALRQSGKKPTFSVTEAEDWLWAVRVAARNHLYPMRCLQRSLTLQFLFSRIGLVTELRIGVRRDEQLLAAHAWLECDGRPIGDLAELVGRYRLLQSVGASRG